MVFKVLNSFLFVSLFLVAKEIRIIVYGTFSQIS